MAKPRKKKQSPDDDRVTFIYVHFARRTEEVLDLDFALEDLIGDDGEVRGSSEGADGEFDADGRGWGYEALIYDPAGVDRWADRLAAELPALLRECGESQRPWLEVVTVGRDDAREVLRRIKLGKGGRA
jgi:hypothetical protein